MPRRGTSSSGVRVPQRSEVLWERVKVVVQTLSMKSFEDSMSKAQVALREHDMRRLGEIYQSALEVEVRLLEEIDLALGYEDEGDIRTEAAVDDQVAAKVASHGLWILARVASTTSDGDFVEVEDVDDDAQRRYRVKKRDVLLLPRTSAEVALARASFKPPRFVFAMYPETTSFYKAQVIAPSHISSSSEEVCLVQFADDEDDDGATPSRSIPLGFITHLPE